MENKTQELYDSRIKATVDTCNLSEPEFVPVMSNVATWPIGYAHAKYWDLLEYPERIPEVTLKYFDEIYADIAFNYFGINAPINAFEKLGTKSFFISEDGYTVQHLQNTEMKEDEYGMLCEDPKKFLLEVIAKRKFSALKTKEEAREALIYTMSQINILGKYNAETMKIAKEKYGVPLLAAGPKVYPTLDVIFDKIRGFRQTLTDIKRHRNEVLEAVNALKPLYAQLCALPPNTPAFPYARDTLHIPTYLSAKDFEELFFPCWYEFLKPIMDTGKKVVCALEGEWERFFPILKDRLPKGGLVCALDGDDLFETKKHLGDHFALIGGVPTGLLRYSSKEKCIDEAKKILDICAPGGGFIFSTEKTLCTLSDVNVENFKAVNEYVHINGRYQ